MINLVRETELQNRLKICRNVELYILTYIILIMLALWVLQCVPKRLYHTFHVSIKKQLEINQSNLNMNSGYLKKKMY